MSDESIVTDDNEPMTDSAMLAEIVATMRDVKVIAVGVKEQMTEVMAALHQPGGFMKLMTGKLL